MCGGRCVAEECSCARIKRMRDGEQESVKGPLFLFASYFFLVSVCLVLKVD